ncbi:MAG: hypothetical protein IT233_12565 [Bacteroidia bacterium]|nr:hypothetical protein [Bacteroidia bacterium]
MKKYLRNILKDKTGTYSLRETVVAIFVVVTLIAWIGEQFFYLHVPEFMFYGFVSLIAAGCFGYSFERKPTNPFNTENEQKPE